MITLYMEPPPSANNLFRERDGKQGRTRTAKYNEWTDRAVTRIRLQKVEPIDGRVVVLVGIGRENKAADIDNRLKPTLDALKKAHVFKDDNLVTMVAGVWMPKTINTLMTVLIVPASKPLHFVYRPTDSVGATGGLFLLAPEENGEHVGDLSLIHQQSAGDETSAHSDLQRAGAGQDVARG